MLAGIGGPAPERGTPLTLSYTSSTYIRDMIFTPGPTFGLLCDFSYGATSYALRGILFTKSLLESTMTSSTSTYPFSDMTLRMSPARWTNFGSA
jgi:hypothetical protein